MIKKAGTAIGQGCSKICYEVRGRPSLVMIIGDEEELREEERNLRKLRRKGLPAFHGRFEEVKTQNGSCMALVGRRYDFHTLAGDRHCYDGWDSLPLKEGHIRNLRAIRTKLLKKRIWCPDLQFLFRGKAEVVISDPGRVEWRGARQSQINNGPNAIQEIIRCFRRAQKK